MITVKSVKKLIDDVESAGGKPREELEIVCGKDAFERLCDLMRDASPWGRFEFISYEDIARNAPGIHFFGVSVRRDLRAPPQSLYVMPREAIPA